MMNSDHKSPDERVKWAPEEDSLLTVLVNINGTNKWKKTQSSLIEQIPHFEKSAKQCRERWHNYLNPHIQKNEWTELEVDTLFQNHKIYGSKWSLIGKSLSGRTDNAIKNVFYCRMRKMVRRLAKNSVCSDQHKTLKEYEHSLYILEIIKYGYIHPLQTNKSSFGDQYIVNILKQHSIDIQVFNGYISKLLSEVPESMKSYTLDHYPRLVESGEEKDDSLTHSSLHSSEPALLPAFVFERAPKRRAPCSIDEYSKSLFSFSPYMKRKQFAPIIVQ